MRDERFQLAPLEESLFVPLFGRIYASEHFPQILYESRALSVRGKLPRDRRGGRGQTQYTLIAGAVRSANMDRIIRDFLARQGDGVIVQLGCGLETTLDRIGKGAAEWVAIDLPRVIRYRETLLGKDRPEDCIAADVFDEREMRTLIRRWIGRPILFTASGLFYYFSRERVKSLLSFLCSFPRTEIVFDAVNAFGMRRMSHYMKQVGCGDLAVSFFVDQGKELAAEVGAELFLEEAYYSHTERKGLSWPTRITMMIADRFGIVKMLHLGGKQ